MSWHGSLALRYRRDGARTVAHDRHDGPLRVLKALYPEGDGVCHHVLVHPPGGIAGGDRLDIDVTLEPGAHALITTPGATRFHRSSGAPAQQTARIDVQRDARLEWLPMATLAFDGCLAENRGRFVLAEGATMIGADLLGLACRHRTRPSREAASRSASSGPAAGSSAARSTPQTCACAIQRWAWADMP